MLRTKTPRLRGGKARPRATAAGSAVKAKPAAAAAEGSSPSGELSLQLEHASSCCAACVNARLLEYHTRLHMMRSLPDSLQARITARLEAKSKADEQRIWRVSKTQDIMELRDQLTELKRKNTIEKTKVQQLSSDLKAQTSLNLAFVTLKKRRADAVTMHTNSMKVTQMNLMATTSERLKTQSKSVKQLCRLFPMRRVGSYHASSLFVATRPPTSGVLLVLKVSLLFWLAFGVQELGLQRKQRMCTGLL